MSVNRSEEGVAQGAGVVVFGGILLALAITTAFDTFFRHAGGITDVHSLWPYFSSSLTLHILKSTQLFVFLFTAVRFYWGTYRYHVETWRLHGVHFVLGMFGAILVFSGFYITAIYITNITLFYVGFLLFHFFDFIWFIWVYFVERKNEAQVIRRISNFWTMLDVITIGLLIAGIGMIMKYPGHLIVQYLTLVALLAIGIFDLWNLWHFYTNENWRAKPFRLGKRIDRLQNSFQSAGKLISTV